MMIDLHGESRDIARCLVVDFIHDAYRMEEEKVIIVHGIGNGILKKEVHNVLKKSKEVKKFYIDFYNVGQTIVEIKERN